MTGSSRSSGFAGNLALLNGFLGNRKDIAITPSTKMKQLQWDKVPQQQVGKTLWQAETPEKEQEWLAKMQVEGIWRQMEEDFRAKQLVVNLMGM